MRRNVYERERKRECEHERILIKQCQDKIKTKYFYLIAIDLTTERMLSKVYQCIKFLHEFCLEYYKQL